MNLGIDLDETIITSDNNTWKFKDGCVDNLVLLRDRGYIFHIITARCKDKYNDTQLGHIIRSLLSKGINIQSLTYTCGRAKGSSARKLGCSYMIDDNMDFLSDCLNNAVIPVHLIPSPDSDVGTACIVVYSWDDISSVLP